MEYVKGSNERESQKDRAIKSLYPAHSIDKIAELTGFTERVVVGVLKKHGLLENDYIHIPSNIEAAITEFIATKGKVEVVCQKYGIIVSTFNKYLKIRRDQASNQEGIEADSKKVSAKSTQMEDEGSFKGRKVSKGNGDSTIELMRTLVSVIQDLQKETEGIKQQLLKADERSANNYNYIIQRLEELVGMIKGVSSQQDIDLSVILEQLGDISRGIEAKSKLPNRGDRVIIQEPEPEKQTQEVATVREQRVEGDLDQSQTSGEDSFEGSISYTDEDNRYIEGQFKQYRRAKNSGELFAAMRIMRDLINKFSDLDEGKHAYATTILAINNKQRKSGVEEKGSKLQEGRIREAEAIAEELLEASKNNGNEQDEYTLALLRDTYFCKFNSCILDEFDRQDNKRKLESVVSKLLGIQANNPDQMRRNSYVQTELRKMFEDYLTREDEYKFELANKAFYSQHDFASVIEILTEIKDRNPYNADVLGMMAKSFISINIQKVVSGEEEKGEEKQTARLQQAERVLFGVCDNDPNNVKALSLLKVIYDIRLQTERNSDLRDRIEKQKKFTESKIGDNSIAEKIELELHELEEKLKEEQHKNKSADMKKPSLEEVISRIEGETTNSENVRYLDSMARIYPNDISLKLGMTLLHLKSNKTRDAIAVLKGLTHMDTMSPLQIKLVKDYLQQVAKLSPKERAAQGIDINVATLELMQNLEPARDVGGEVK